MRYVRRQPRAGLARHRHTLRDGARLGRRVRARTGQALPNASARARQRLVRGPATRARQWELGLGVRDRDMCTSTNPVPLRIGKPQDKIVTTLVACQESGKTHNINIREYGAGIPLSTGRSTSSNSTPRWTSRPGPRSMPGC